MKKLIIGEKPSLAKTIANALNVKKFTGENSNGYYENDNYIVSWCFGHLLQLKDVKEYPGYENTKWKDITSPFLPKEFEYKIKIGRDERETNGVIKQIDLLKELVNRDDVNEIVNCGDAGREGQIIVDELLNYLNNKKKVTRLWLPEQTEETIREQIRNCKDNEEYQNLRNEGFARMYMDWILGINLTAFLSTKAGKKLNVGRVLIPIVKYIYDRDREIKNFKPEKYYQLESDCEKNGIKIPLKLKSLRYFDLESAEEKIKILNQNKAIVTSIEKKETTSYPSKLFSLGKVQSELSKRHKMNFEKSLEVIQKLYEEGYVTYPRTNTEYLAEEEKDRVKKLIDNINKQGYELEFKDRSSVFDSSKVESHSALTPTLKLPEKLTKDEEIVYQVIFNRFVSNFLKEETILAKTTMTISVGDEKFRLKGTEIIKEGFYKYEPKKFDNQLPNLSENDEFEVNFKPIEKETTPPKKVTETDLENHLENPFRKEREWVTSEEDIYIEPSEVEEVIEEEEEYKAKFEGIEIGTVATRTGIIKNAKDYGYISQENSIFSITKLGEKLIALLDDLRINLYKEKTVDFSKDLKKIYNNSLSIEASLENVYKVLDEIMLNGKDKIPKVHFMDSVGKCPKCNGNVFEKPKTFNCENNDFTLWKDSKYYKEKFSINENDAKKFLNGEKVQCTLTSEDNKTRKINLKMKLNGEYVNFEEEKENIGKCPVCGKEVAESEKMFYCIGYKDGCKFKLWKETKHYSDVLKIDKSTAKKLLKKNGSAKFEVTKKDGTKREANLKIKINGDYVNFEEVKEDK